MAKTKKDGNADNSNSNNDNSNNNSGNNNSNNNQNNNNSNNNSGNNNSNNNQNNNNSNNNSGNNFDNNGNYNSNNNDQLKQAINENKRNDHQELVEAVRYPALKLVVRFSKMAGIILGIFFILIAIVMLFIADNWGDAFFYFFLCFLLGILHFIGGWFIGDFFQLWIDLEENTRRGLEGNFSKRPENKDNNNSGSNNSNNGNNNGNNNSNNGSDNSNNNSNNNNSNNNN